jgi:hypothetical protein
MICTNIQATGSLSVNEGNILNYNSFLASRQDWKGLHFNFKRVRHVYLFLNHNKSSSGSAVTPSSFQISKNW